MDWPSNTSSSCPPTRFRYTTAARSPAPAPAGSAALLALAPMVGGGIDVEDEPRPGIPRARRGLRLPDVLAHREPHGHTTHPDNTGLVTRHEVALLVEHAVVGQDLLVVAGGDDGRRAAAGRCCAGPARRAWAPPPPRQCPHLPGQAVQRPFRAIHEACPQQQVLRRIAGDGQFGKQHEVRAQFVPGLERPVAMRSALPSTSPTSVSTWARAIFRGYQSWVVRR
jgi:hypothetical protein